MVTDISHEGLRQLLLEESVRFQAVRTWKRSTDPDFVAKRDRIIDSTPPRRSARRLAAVPHDSNIP